jgi:malate dehydrogenase (oxaloacetate-decarboxylating)
MAANVSFSIHAAITAQAGMLGKVLAAIGDAGGEVGGVDIVRSTRDHVVRAITVAARDDDHGAAIAAALDAIDGVEVLSVQDRVEQVRQGGIIGMRNRAPLETRDDLSMAYTPGVARVCMEIHHHPERVWDLTIRGNSVMVVSDGSSVVGMGDLGHEASLPALEAKCLFLRELASVDAFPIPLAVREPADAATHITRISSVFAGVHLADIAAPRCFRWQEALEASLDIPVFHEDQQGTAASMLAAVTNALTVAGKSLEDASVVVAGLGPAAHATVWLLLAVGVKSLVVADKEGVLTADRPGADEYVMKLAEATNPGGLRGSLSDALKGADVFIGLSAPDIVTVDDLRAMAPEPVVLAMANPSPEIDPADALGVAAVVGTGRPDFPNQINSSLTYPGLWRGALDCRARTINRAMVIAAADAIAGIPVDEGALAADYIVPSVFNPRLVPAVAQAVREAAEATGVAQLQPA